jgi:hypothetical protein
MTKKIDAQISILARPKEGSGTHQDQLITISLYDKVSGCQLFEVELSADRFVEAAMGRLAHTKCEATISEFGLKSVGKTYRSVRASVELPPHIKLSGYSNQAASKWLNDNIKGVDGWQVDAYLGSQSSISYVPGGTGKIANFNFFIYLPQDVATPEPRWEERGSAVVKITKQEPSTTKKK